MRIIHHTARREGLFPFVVFFAFLELGFCFQSNCSKTSPLVRIGRDLVHCSEILNVLSCYKALHGTPPPGTCSLGQR
jgi:hypothetical protein